MYIQAMTSHIHYCIHQTKGDFRLGTIKTKIAEWAKDKALMKLLCAAAAVVLALVIGLCISNIMRSNIQKKYSASIGQLQVHAYQNMTTMTELFARIEDPTVDVRYKLLPALKSHYSAVVAINAALSAAEAEPLLNAEQIAAFDAAFEQYEEAYRQGSATGLAKADMAVCMEDVQEMVTLYNTPPESEQDKVLIIDAASGKAVQK